MLGERADTRRISIHAPPRGATHGGGVLLVSLEMISIHAPPRGATRAEIARHTADKFQFTPLREGRPAPERAEIISPAISIHAPPRGATAPNSKKS